MKAFIHRIRYFFFNKTLAGLIPQGVKRKMINLQQARTIGIAYDATNSAHDHAIEDFISTLKGEKKEIDVIGYIADVQKDQVVEDFKFTNKETTWSYIPQTPLVDQFIAKEYDILICLHTEPCPPLEYVAALSHARFRVGKYFAHQEKYFEWMINDEEGHSIDYLIRQVRTFLSKLKTS